MQPHEPALRAYLQTRFPALSDHDNLLQETYTRVFRSQAAGNIRSDRAVLFTRARNAALGLFRRRRAAPLEVVTDSAASAVLEEAPGVPEIVGQRHERALPADAVRALPERCRQVILLRYLDGLSYKEITARLDVSPENMKTQITRGLHACEAHFAARGLLRPKSPSEAASA